MRVAIIFCLAFFSAAILASDHGEQEAAPAPDPEKVWAELAAGNKRFVAGRPMIRDVVKARTEVAKGQSPRVIVVACADSRVSPELLFDETLGGLFVVRTAGNIADKIALGSMEYAAEHLGSTVLLVVGHESCGAVGAAASGDKMPSKNLDAIVNKIEPALKESRKAGLTGDMLAAKGIELNVRQSVRDILKDSEILSKRAAEGKLTVIAAVYKLASGEVVRLKEEPAAPTKSEEKETKEKDEKEKKEKEKDAAKAVKDKKSETDKKSEKPAQP